MGNLVIALNADTLTGVGGGNTVTLTGATATKTVSTGGKAYGKIAQTTGGTQGTVLLSIGTSLPGCTKLRIRGSALCTGNSGNRFVTLTAGQTYIFQCILPSGNGGSINVSNGSNSTTTAFSGITTSTTSPYNAICSFDVTLDITNPDVPVLKAGSVFKVDANTYTLPSDATCGSATGTLQFTIGGNTGSDKVELYPCTFAYS